MHPIERLRYVARSSGAPQDLLVGETAVALSSFRDDPSGLVTACRRIVSRQLTSGPLWWLCSRMLCAPDPIAEGRVAAEEIANDPTPRALEFAIPDGARVTVLGWSPQIDDTLVRRGDVTACIVDVAGEGRAFVTHLWDREAEAFEVPLNGLGAVVVESDLVLLDASAVGPTEFVAVSGSRAAAAVARDAGVPVWVVAGIGRMLPQRVWDAMAGRLDEIADPWDLDDEVVPLTLVDDVVGPKGLEAPADAVHRTDCPIAPELFKSDVT
ncbi:MAG: hypothetical protein ACR2O6_01420 [Ilumatobacteraceae bacterium]